VVLAGARFARDAPTTDGRVEIFQERDFRAADAEHGPPIFATVYRGESDGPFAVDDARQVRGIAG
jgi:hypothetical protein